LSVSHCRLRAGRTNAKSPPLKEGAPAKLQGAVYRPALKGSIFAVHLANIKESGVGRAPQAILSRR